VAGDCGSERIITRRWTSEDECGNISHVDQIITIRDATAAVLTCPENTTISCEEAITLTIDFTDQNNGVLTECGGNTGTIVRTWTVY